MKTHNIVIVSVLLFLLVYIYIQFQFPSDTTIYIEDQYVEKIRDDDRVTIYEYPPKETTYGKMLTEVRLHRCFYSRQFHCTAPNTMEIQIVVFPPEQSKYVYYNTHLLRFSQSSPINVYEPMLDTYPLFKNAEYIEIPIIGGQSFVIPRGWWVFIDSPSHYGKVFLIF